MITLGIDRLIAEKSWQEKLRGKRVALVAHPASVNSSMQHSLDALVGLNKLNITACFGPQHGMRGDKQDNMIESDDYKDPQHGIPVFSLYGKVRRPTPEMLNTFDVVLVDMQDVGCRIYTFLTTLFYLMDDCAAAGKEVWVLDRPNPAGRPIEGNKLDMNFASFVGGAALPMRHGCTLGEAAIWYRTKQKRAVKLEVVAMKGYDPLVAPGFGWPEGELTWVNPSPNMPRLSTARQYAGTVLFEGTKFSEGRGTTRPLEIFGAPGWDTAKIIRWMSDFSPQWLRGCRLRSAFYEPTFHKFKGQLVSAVQIHVDGPYYLHEEFKPYRLAASFLKAVNTLYPDFELWLQPPYEYETVKMPIDILSGSTFLREWVGERKSRPVELENYLFKDEQAWFEEIRPHWLY